MYVWMDYLKIVGLGVNKMSLKVEWAVEILHTLCFSKTGCVVK